MTELHDYNRYRKVDKLGMERNFICMVKSIYENPTANILLNGKRLKDFPLNRKQDVTMLYVTSFLVNIALEFPA